MVWIAQEWIVFATFLADVNAAVVPVPVASGSAERDLGHWGLQEWANFATVLGGIAAVVGVAGGAKFLLDYRIEERRIRQAREDEAARLEQQQKFEMVQGIRAELATAYRDLIQFRTQHVERVLGLTPSQMLAFQPTMNSIVVNTANALRTVREMARIVKENKLSDLEQEILEHVRFLLRIADEDLNLTNHFSKRQLAISKFVATRREADGLILSPATLDAAYYESDPNYPVERMDLTVLTAFVQPADAVNRVVAELKELEPYFEKKVESKPTKPDQSP